MSYYSHCCNSMFNSAYLWNVSAKGLKKKVCKKNSQKTHNNNLYSAVHNEVTYRSLENFIPRTDTQQIYKNDILDSASYSQAGSFFPDW